MNGGTCASLMGADLLECHLGGRKVPALIPDAAAVQGNPFHASPIGGMRVPVAEKDLEAATELL